MKILKGPLKLDANEMISRVKSHPKISAAGMILLHNGIVRGLNLEKKVVTSINVSVNEDRLIEILDEAVSMSGIIFVDAEICYGDLKPGDDLMLLCVAGDVRSNVLDVMKYALDRIKKEVTAKEENLCE